MKQEEIQALLEALAVGDSFAKCTEFASRGQITKHFEEIREYLTPEESLAHRDMAYAQITDDTEQNLFLLEDYIKNGQVTPEIAAKSLLRWFTETPEPLKYIGPSSLKALSAIQNGADLYQAGVTGTSCGGIMRAPAAFLCSTDLEDLERNIIATLLPTHNTAAAMEAALGYGFALYAMTETKDLSMILELSCIGCRKGRLYPEKNTDNACVPSCESRIRFLYDHPCLFTTDSQLLDFLFYCFGTTISSCDVFTAAFALFLWCEEDVWKAVRLAAMLGGDTDTIGCLAAVLCCVYAGKHNLPKQVVATVTEQNHLDFSDLANRINCFRSEKTKGKIGA
jgi:ADP-ribosylglycohydrolase